MVFEDHEKRIYTGLNGTKYDPLALNRAIVEATSGQLASAIDAWNAGLPSADGTGDIALKRKPEQEVAAAKAEAFLVTAARKVFALPDFPDCLDGEALESLFDFTGWLEKKGVRESGLPAA